MQFRERKSVRIYGPIKVVAGPVGAEKLPELSNLGFEKRLDAAPRRREVIRYSSHARFLARWSAP